MVAESNWLILLKLQDALRFKAPTLNKTTGSWLGSICTAISNSWVCFVLYFFFLAATKKPTIFVITAKPLKLTGPTNVPVSSCPILSLPHCSQTFAHTTSQRLTSPRSPVISKRQIHLASAGVSEVFYLPGHSFFMNLSTLGLEMPCLRRTPSVQMQPCFSEHHFVVCLLASFLHISCQKQCNGF